MSNIEWKDIKGYEGLYQISTSGIVKSMCRLHMKSDFLKKASITKDGYHIVSLFINKRPFIKRIHRLVAEAFVSNPLNNNEVNHIDGNKNNNDSSNLEWVNHARNMEHAGELGLMNGLKGTRNPKCKITEEQAIEIFRSTDQLKDIVKTYKLCPSTVCRIRNGQYWSHVTTQTA